MIAWLVRAILAGELLAALAAGWWLSSAAGWPPLAAGLVAAGLPALLHAAVIGLQSLGGAWHRARFARETGASPLPSGPAVRAWLGETAASLRSFVLLMPWFGDAPLPTGRDPRRVPVVLVHGYFCNRAVWRPLARWLAARGHPVESVNLEPPFAPVESYLPALEKAVERLRARTGARRVALIGHSMGGLVIRAWIARHGDRRVAAVVTLGSPHQGTWSARFGMGRNVAQMQPGSRFLAGLDASETPSARALFTVILTLHDNIVMPQAAQTLEGARHRVLHGVGHMALVHANQVRPHLAEALEQAEARAREGAIERGEAGVPIAPVPQP